MDFPLYKHRKIIHNTINEMMNTLEGINNKLDEAEDWIRDLEDKVGKKKTLNQTIKKKSKNLMRRV